MIQSIKVEFVDKDSRLVLKKLITTDGREIHNRKLAVCNSIYSCERQRLIYGKSMFNSLFQTYHIGWDKKESEWDYKGLKNAEAHAKQNKRLFVPYKQRNEEQWSKLNWKEADKEFKKFQEETDIVPYPVPLNASLKELKNKKSEVLKLLEPNQELIFIVSSKHLNLKEFPLIAKYELKNSKLFGICSYGISDVIERRNLSYLNAINSSFEVGQNIALIFCFDYSRILKNHSYIAGCFGFSCFGGDVFSEKASFPFQWGKKAFEKVTKKSPSKYPLYDIKEKKFTTSLPQKEWYGFDFTKGFMDKIAVSEGLIGYNALKWANHHLQQKDLDFINQLLIQRKNVIESMKNYTGWNVFLAKAQPNSSIIQQTLE